MIRSVLAVALVAACLAMAWPAPLHGEGAAQATLWHLPELPHRVPLTVRSDLYRQRDRLLVHLMPALAATRTAPTPALRVVEWPSGRLLPAALREAQLQVRLPGLLAPAQRRRLLVYYGPKVAGLPLAPGAPWPVDQPPPGSNLVADPSLEGTLADAATGQGWRRLDGRWRKGVRLESTTRTARLGNKALLFAAVKPGDGLCYRLVQSAPFAVQPAARLLFGGWATTLEEGGSTGIYIRFYNAKGRFLGRRPGEVQATASVIRRDGWQRLQQVAVAPHKTASARLQIGRCWRGGKVVYDDLFARLIDREQALTVTEHARQDRP